MTQIVKVKGDRAAEFDQLHSGKPCMNARLTFEVVAKPDDRTVTVKSELAGTFENDYINKAHKFNTRADLFEPVEA